MSVGFLLLLLLLLLLGIWFLAGRATIQRPSKSRSKNPTDIPLSPAPSPYLLMLLPLSLSAFNLCASVVSRSFSLGDYDLCLPRRDVGRVGQLAAELLPGGDGAAGVAEGGDAGAGGGAGTRAAISTRPFPVRRRGRISPGGRSWNARSALRSTRCRLECGRQFRHGP